MIGFLYVFLLSSVLVDVTLSDGQAVSGDLKQIANGTVVIATDPKPREFSFQGVSKLAFSKQQSVDASKQRSVVELRDGSVLRTQLFRTTAKGKEAVVGDKVPAACSLDLVHSVRFFGDDVEIVEQWKEITSSVAGDDFLVVNKKGNLDYLAGLILGVSPDEVEFNYADQNLKIPMAKVAGIVFAKKSNDSAAAKMVLTTASESVWQLRSLTSDGTSLKLISVGGAKQQLPLSEVQAIEFLRAGVVYLTDLDPEDMAYEPYLGSGFVADSLKMLGLPQDDVSFDGSPLRVVDAQGQTRQFKRGLAMYSRSEVVYRLAKKYQRFQTTVGFHPMAPREGNVELRLFADKNEIVRQTLSQADAAIEIDVSVANANRLKILVDYGENMDIGDQIHLGDARLTK